jgi:hypothetical protein
MTPPDEPERGRDVLSSLPSSRPQRASARRGTGAAKGRKPAAAGSAAKPRAVASKAKAKARPAAKAKPKSATTRAKAGAGARPKAVRPSAATRRARVDAPQADRAPAPPAGAELVTTAVQAAGELAQIGLTLGTQALRGALSRIPRP